MPLSINESTVIRQHRPISCAECRRLKLRCDRTFPCSSCERRGCAALCPDGVLPTTRAKANARKARVQSADKDESTDALRQRIRELESELAALQTLRGSSEETENHSEKDNAVVVDELTENLGTLSITGYGRSRFFGTVGRALAGLNVWNYRVIAEGVEESSESASRLETSLQGLPAEIIYLSSAFLPRQTPNSSTISKWMVDHLPSYDEAQKLCETFFENGAYVFIPILRSMFMEEIFSFFYNPKEAIDVDIPQGHRLALLYMVFALGELFDLDKPARPTGGNRFYYLARAALALEPFYDQPTLTGLQAHVMMCVFLAMSDHSGAMELVYFMSATNIRLSFILGLHREWQHLTQKPQPSTDGEDPSHSPKPKEQELRRILFLMVIHFELWQSLQFGRPSQLNLDQFDIASPGIFTGRDSPKETDRLKTQIWAYNFLRDCGIPVLNSVVAVKPPKYSEIIELEKKIEDYPVSELNRDAFYESAERNSRGFRIFQFSTYCHKETLSLCLHRQYFSFAVSHYKDPLGCPFGRSVYISFVNSCKIVSKIALVLEKEPKLSVRVYIFWAQLLIPCIFGTIIIRSPGCDLASTALAQLDEACAVLQRASEGFKPAALLPHTLKLLEKARTVYESHYSCSGAVPHAAIDVSRLGVPPRAAGLAGHPVAVQNREPQFIEHPDEPSAPALFVEMQLHHVEQANTQPLSEVPTGPTTSQASDMNFTPWNINTSADAPSVDFNEIPEMLPNTNTSEGPFHLADWQDWTNQLLSLLPPEAHTSGPGLDPYSNVTYPDPPIATTQHTTWETLFCQMMQ